MDVISFRVQEFRSILDSGWHNFSKDGITTIVGQNESGKTSLLDALSFAAIAKKNLTSLDVRTDGGLPCVSLKIKLTKNELTGFLDDSNLEFNQLVQDAFKSSDYIAELETKWKDDQGTGTVFSIISPVVIPEISDNLKGIASEDALVNQSILEKFYSYFVEEIFEAVPYFALFDEAMATLPDSILLPQSGEKKDLKSAKGAENFLIAADLNLKDLVKADERRRGTLIARANDKINTDLDKYWSQLQGNKKKIRINCQFDIIAPGSVNAGEPRLLFWVTEGIEKLYPSQRSRGTRWFISVFLHLIATEKDRKNYFVLLDEPGSYLHPKAQEDVKQLIDRVSKTYPVIYTTHNPELIDLSKPYRIIAAERTGDSDLGDTQFFDAMKFANASIDTLSPIFIKAGISMARQSVIKKIGNVVLEEPSAHFYFKAFEKILYPSGTGLSFVPASGADNVPTIFALLIAWGLKFCVLLDDDSKGRNVRSQLIKNYFADDSALAQKTIIKLKDCDGVEDMFDGDDFYKIVLEGLYVSADLKKNSAFVKDNKEIKKPLIAYNLFRRVETGELTSSSFSEATIQKFQSVFTDLLSSTNN